jgi:hypothetical protein
MTQECIPTGRITRLVFSGFRNSVLVPAFISNVPDGWRQSVRYPMTSLENSLRITARATP